MWVGIAPVPPFANHSPYNFCHQAAAKLIDFLIELFFNSAPIGPLLAHISVFSVFSTFCILFLISGSSKHNLLNHPSALFSQQLSTRGTECNHLVQNLHEYYTCRREKLLVGCGEICDTTILGEKSLPAPTDLHFNYVEKRFECMDLWANPFIDAGLLPQELPPPKQVPKFWRDDFSHGGRIFFSKEDMR